MISINDAIQCAGEFRMEISGRGLDHNFIVKKTELLRTVEGEKYVPLHRALPEGAIAFIRLLATEPATGSVPVACRVEGDHPMDWSKCCQMRHSQLRL